MLDNIIELSTESLVEAHWNYKVDNPDLIETLANNLKKNGQLENIIVRSLDDDKYEVVKGNHRLKAINHLGIDKVVCYNLGEVNDLVAKRIAIETNETKFQADNIRLAELIKEQTEAYDINDLESTLPYSLQELEDFANSVDMDWDLFKEGGNSNESNGDLDFSKQIIIRVPNDMINTVEEDVKKLLQGYPECSMEVK